MLVVQPTGPEAVLQCRVDGSIIFDARRAPGGPDPRWFDQPGETRAGGRGAVVHLRLPDGTNAVRRHYRRGGLVARAASDRYLFTGAEHTRAFREFRVTASLRRRGFAVPHPIAARFVRQGLFYRADIVTEELQDVRTLAQLEAASLQCFDWHGLGRFLGAFHRAGLWHADLNAHNVLVRDDGSLVLIDFDRARLGVRSRSRHAANLSRLRRSLRKLEFAQRLPDFGAACAAIAAGHAQALSEPRP